MKLLFTLLDGTKLQTSTVDDVEPKVIASAVERGSVLVTDDMIIRCSEVTHVQFLKEATIS